MPRSDNQKLKILYLMKILLEQTDETHSLTMPQIVAALAAYDISAERKGLYDDMERLRVYGLDIIGEKQGSAYAYYVASRQFELPELKLLVDSVQSAKFITAKKSQELISKLTQLASRHEATQLQRQVYVGERLKAVNESIYYNVDAIHAAIHSGSQITFQYFRWDENKQMVLRHDGALYHVSPWALSMDDENYYLIAFDSAEDKIKHFRVDKMLHIEMTGELREGQEHFERFDMAVYARKMFGMFSGEEQLVKLECVNSLAGVIIDRFGTDVSLHKIDSEHFTVNVKVAVSRQFLAWVMSIGEGMRIVGPEDVVERMREEVDRLVKQYGK